MSEQKLKTQNISAIRSKEWILQALLEIMKIKDFHEITIKEINEKADISRQTFYRHFKSKEQVIVEYIESLYNDLDRELKVSKIQSIYEFAQVYYTFWLKHSDFLLTILKSKGEVFLSNNYYMFMKNQLDFIRDQYHFKKEMEIDYAKNFIIGGLIGMKKQWVQNDFDSTPEQLAIIIHHMIHPARYMK